MIFVSSTHCVPEAYLAHTRSNHSKENFSPKPDSTVSLGSTCFPKQVGGQRGPVTGPRRTGCGFRSTSPDVSHCHPRVEAAEIRKTFLKANFQADRYCPTQQSALWMYWKSQLLSREMEQSRKPHGVWLEPEAKKSQLSSLVQLLKPRP